MSSQERQSGKQELLPRPSATIEKYGNTWLQEHMIVPASPGSPIRAISERRAKSCTHKYKARTQSPDSWSKQLTLRHRIDALTRKPWVGQGWDRHGLRLHLDRRFLCATCDCGALSTGFLVNIPLAWVRGCLKAIRLNPGTD